MDLGCVVDFFWDVSLVFGVGCLCSWESLRLGTERRPKNLIMGVCLKRTLVARIFAVVVCVCVCVCVWS